MISMSKAAQLKLERQEAKNKEVKLRLDHALRHLEAVQEVTSLVRDRGRRVSGFAAAQRLASPTKT